MRIALLSLLFLLALPARLLTAEDDTLFDSRALIEEWIDSRKGFGSPEFEYLELGDERFYVGRFVPTSGLDHCHVYTFRGSDGRWRLVRHAKLPGGCHITTRADEASGTLLYMGATGAELDRLVR